MIDRKIQFFSLVVFSVLLAIGSPSPATATTEDFTIPNASSTISTADPFASQKAKAVLNYLFNLPNGSNNRMVSGQFEEASPNTDNIYRATGKYVGLLGRDYFYGGNLATQNTRLINYSNNSGLVTITDHFNNPATGGDAWDSNIDLGQLVTPGTSSNTALNNELNRITSGLSELQNNNVVVLFRPYHEMNGGWFWWGGKDPQQYKNLWIYTFNYLTQTKGLHNLLWVYSSNASLDMTYYPGSQYVDVLGVDIYGVGTNIPQVSGYSQISTFGKPFAITELGPCDASLTELPSQCPPQDIYPIITSIKQNMPKAVFWLSWDRVFSLDYNLNAKQLLEDPWVVTRDEISLPGGSSDPTPPAGPTRLRIR